MNTSTQKPLQKLHPLQPTFRLFTIFKSLTTQLIIFLTLSGLLHQSTTANLYSDFNNRLDLISNLAKNQLEKHATSAFDEIYEKSGNLLKRQMLSKGSFGNEYDDENSMATRPKKEEIEKFINVIAPYYYGDDLENYRVDQQQGGQIFDDTTEMKMQHGRNVEDNRNFRDIWMQNDEGIKYIEDENGENYDIASKGRDWESYGRSKRKNVEKDIVKRYGAEEGLVDPKPIMNSAPSLYPGVVAKTADLIAPRLDTSNFNQNPASLNVNNPPSLQVSNQRSELEDFFKRNAALIDQLSKQASRSAEQATFEGTQPSNILDKVLNELEAIRELNSGNSTKDGTPCEIAGFWNSELAGVRFDIDIAKQDSSGVSLKIQLHTKRTKVKDPLMDTKWNCTGMALDSVGGPLHMTAFKKSEQISGMFSGYCMKCGGVDTVFGSWTFIHPCAGCAEISMAVETKRDIFRRDVEEERKAREKKNKKEKTKRKISISYEDKEGSYYDEEF